MLIKIYDKYYNIYNFLDQHPGGKKLLESCEGIDATAAFESYHVFCNMKKIKQIMKIYEVNNPEYEIASCKYTFYEKDFYSDVKDKVISHFDKKTIKWNYMWLGCGTTSVSIYIYTFLFSFLGIEHLFIYRAMASFISGIFLVCSMLCIYHDSSHFAISKNKFINETIFQVGSALAFWDWTTWAKHHSILHHSFTGDYKLDPDMRHTHPFFKKHILSKANLVKNAYTISAIMTLFPGMYLGQMLSYLYVQYYEKLWGFKIIKKKTKLEWIILITQLAIMTYNKSLVLIAIFFFGLNLTYSIAILPDHDQLETRLNDCDKTTDWGELQVRHSGNFAPQNWIYTYLSGGINYQIEHHLFPSVCSCHLPEISIIVQSVCRKHNIKYVSNPSLIGSYKSAIKNLYLINKTD